MCFANFEFVLDIVTIVTIPKSSNQMAEGINFPNCPTDFKYLEDDMELISHRQHKIMLEAEKAQLDADITAILDGVTPNYSHRRHGEKEIIQKALPVEEKLTQKERGMRPKEATERKITARFTSPSLGRKGSENGKPSLEAKEEAKECKSRKLTRKEKHRMQKQLEQEETLTGLSYNQDNDLLGPSWSVKKQHDVEESFCKQKIRKENRVKRAAWLSVQKEMEEEISAAEKLSAEKPSTAQNKLSLLAKAHASLSAEQKMDLYEWAVKVQKYFEENEQLEEFKDDSALNRTCRVVNERIQTVDHEMQTEHPANPSCPCCRLAHPPCPCCRQAYPSCLHQPQKPPKKPGFLRRTINVLKNIEIVSVEFPCTRKRRGKKEKNGKNSVEEEDPLEGTSTTYNDEDAVEDTSVMHSNDAPLASKDKNKKSKTGWAKLGFGKSKKSKKSKENNYSIEESENVSSEEADSRAAKFNKSSTKASKPKKGFLKRSIGHLFRRCNKVAPLIRPAAEEFLDPVESAMSVVSTASSGSSIWSISSASSGSFWSVSRPSSDTSNWSSESGHISLPSAVPSRASNGSSCWSSESGRTSLRSAVPYKGQSDLVDLEAVEQWCRSQDEVAAALLQEDRVRKEWEMVIEQSKSNNNIDILRLADDSSCSDGEMDFFLAELDELLDECSN